MAIGITIDIIRILILILPKKVLIYIPRAHDTCCMSSFLVINSNSTGQVYCNLYSWVFSLASHIRAYNRNP